MSGRWRHHRNREGAYSRERSYEQSHSHGHNHRHRHQLHHDREHRDRDRERGRDYDYSRDHDGGRYDRDQNDGRRYYDRDRNSDRGYDGGRSASSYYGNGGSYEDWHRIDRRNESWCDRDGLGRRHLNSGRRRGEAPSPYRGGINQSNRDSGSHSRANVLVAAAPSSNPIPVLWRAPSPTHIVRVGVPDAPQVPPLDQEELRSRRSPSLVPIEEVVSSGDTSDEGVIVID